MNFIITKAIAKPTSCIKINIGTDSGAMPANVLVRLRAKVTAGFARDVDDVNQYAPPIQTPTAKGTAEVRPERDIRKITSNNPMVATASESQMFEPVRILVDSVIASRSNIKFAMTVPIHPPIV